MGMLVVPVSSNSVQDKSYPAYGLLHYAGNYSNIRPDEKIITAVKAMTERLMMI